jgi:hypothetical protein
MQWKRRLRSWLQAKGVNSSARTGHTVWMSVVVVAFAFAMLLPLSSDLFNPHREARLISDGTDPRSLLWTYRIIERTFHEHPTRLLFGAIYTDLLNAPNGHLLWVAWIERIIIPIIAPFTNDSTIATLVAWILLSLNGLAMLWLGRVMRWSPWVTLAAAIAFAITPFTRGRVSVHMALAGIYYLPLVLGALERVARWTPTELNWRRAVVVPTLALFGACTVAHYHLIITILLAPFFAVYFLVRARREHAHLFWGRARILACAVTLPVSFLAFQFAVPGPPSLRAKVNAFPEASPQVQTQYLQDVGAHPIDYIAGDVKFGPLDILPARERINAYVLTHLDRSHPHERANGIRWSVLGVAVLAVAYRAIKRARASEQHRSSQAIWLWIVLAAGAFLLALSPRGLVMYGEEYGPSQWANKLVPNFRVPNRFGPVVNLAVIAIVADFITDLVRTKRKLGAWLGRLLGAMLTIAVVIEFIPRTQMLSTPIPAVMAVSQPDGQCGMGVFLPFNSYDYSTLEETRGTRCALLNPSTETLAAELGSRIGQQTFSTPAEQEQLVSLVKCTGIDWLAFRGEVPAGARSAICNTLGWQMPHAYACYAPALSPTKRHWRECPR